MLRQGLELKLGTKLSPQQIQLIKLLEIPAIDLEQRIKKEMEENPALEEGIDEEEEREEIKEEEEEDEFTLEDYLNEEDVPSYRLNAQNHSKDDEKKEMPHSSSSSFYDTLYTQLGLKKIPKEDYEFYGIKCSLGEVVNRIPAKELQDKGVLAQCHVNVLQTQDHPEFKNYPEELKWLQQMINECLGLQKQ